jgi:hypothetical protein
MKINSTGSLKILLLVLCLIALLPVMSYAVLAIQPDGATVNVGNSSTASTSAAGSAQALAGNVTELNLFGYSTTQAWQGYYGNVTGVIQLTDGSGKTMYNWSQASPAGEVYASTNNSIIWSNIQCFNFTATGTHANEAGNGGQTSKFGTNLTGLETAFGINSSDADGLNSTFPLSGVGTHNQFFTANKQFNEGQCRNTRIYDNTGAGVDNKFEEVLLYEPASSSVVFASLLNKDASGFDSKTHDFEMLVLENGHGTDTSTTPYYFYVELQ